jgi:hypothetical protein
VTALGLLGLGLAVAAVVVVGVVVAAVVRDRTRRNRVVPDVPTRAPSEWAGTHTPLARLHRRLRAAVHAARAVPDPDGSLIRARVEIEQAALAVDDHLVALHGIAERERAGRMAAATAAVAAVEQAAARLTDAVSAAPATVLPAVEEALLRAALVEEARGELEAEDVTTWPMGAQSQDEQSSAPGPEEDEDGEGRAQPSTG